MSSENQSPGRNLASSTTQRSSRGPWICRLAGSIYRRGNTAGMRSCSGTYSSYGTTVNNTIYRAAIYTSRRSTWRKSLKRPFRSSVMMSEWAVVAQKNHRVGLKNNGRNQKKQHLMLVVKKRTMMKRRQLTRFHSRRRFSLLRK